MNGIVLVALLAAAPAPTSGSAGTGTGAAKFRKQEVEVTGVPQTQLTKPAPPPKIEKKGPIISLEEFKGQREEKVKEINDKQIELAKRLIRVTEDDDPQKPDFWFRLAELYAENQRYNFFRARQLDQKIFEAPANQKAKLQRDQQGFEKEQEKWLLEAVGAYVQAANSKKYNRMDEVLFKLAYLLQSVKKEDQAREFFHRLIKDYPDSKYVPEAYLSFGEFFFGKGEMDAALKFYERVEKFPKSPVYGYAVYKKGWCWINLGDFKKALTIFVEVINISQQNKGGDKRQNQALEREAKKDVVKAYARVGTPDKAWEFFQRTGGDFAPKMMEALGEIYWEQGMFKESSMVYKKIIALNPSSHRLCEWQNKVVRNTLSAGTKTEQVQEMGRLGLAHEHVTKAPGVKKDILDECRNGFHDTTKELALIWHKEAQKTKNPDTYRLVKYVYKIYLDAFGKEKGGVEMSFYYGEVLWVTEDWKAAAEQYTKVVEMDPKGKYVKESAYAAVLAWKNHLQIDDSGARGDKDTTKEFKAEKIPENWRKMIAAFDTYLKYVPDSDMVVKIKYRKARVFYEYNHFDEAIPFFGDIVERHPKDELAIYSANLLLDCLNIMGRYRDIRLWVEKFTDMPELMKDVEFQKQMIALRLDIIVKEAKEAEQRGDFKECGALMLAAAESMPDHPNTPERLYNAGLCFQNARLIGRAVQARQQLINQFPKDRLAQKALYQIASNYNQLASYRNAADYYEQFATKYPGEKEAAVALGNAYQFRIGLGDFEKAVDDINAFVKFFGGKEPQKSADSYFQMSEVYEKQNRNDELVRHLTQYLKTWGNKGTPDKAILAHFKIGEILWKKSCPKGDGVNGACIEIKRVTATGKQKLLYEMNKKIKDKRKKLKDIRTQCGPPTHSKVTVHDRGPSFSKQAQQHFADALKLWNRDNKKIPADRMGIAAYAAAGSAFFQAESIYEQFLKVKFPEGLDFQQPSQYDSKKKAEGKKKKFAESQKKFLAYLTDKSKLAEKLSGSSADKKGAYDRVVEFKVAHWTVAGAARIGQVWANFVDQLYTAEIPKDLKEQDEWGNRPREIFCDALVDKAEPIESKAVGAYDLCLKAATKESWFNEWSALCETELNQIQPSEYPLAAEAKPEPGYVSTLMSPAQVIPELPVQTTPVAPVKR